MNEIISGTTVKLAKTLAETAEVFEKEHLDRITDRMIELAEQIGVEQRKILSHVLDYRFLWKMGNF